MKRKQWISLVLVFALALAAPAATESQAKKKAALNKKRAVLYVGNSLKLKVKNNEKKVKWSTTKKSVATVSKKGKVKAKKPGKATIKAKFGKKTLKCKITVKKKTIGRKLIVPGISRVSILNECTIQVDISAAQALSISDFVVKTKEHAYGTYNRTLKIDSVVTADKKTYIISLDTESALHEGYSVLVSVKNIKGRGTDTRGLIYSQGEFAYRDTLIYRAAQNEAVSKALSLEGYGYSTYTASGLPAGVRSRLSDDGSQVEFSGKPAKAGTFNGKLITKDEFGNTYNYEMIWLVGNEDTIAAAALPDYYVLGGGESYDFSKKLTVTGGSGSYNYAIQGNDHGLSVDSSGEIRGTLGTVGTYTVNVAVTDRYDANRKTTARVVISLVAGRTISGIVKDAKGNAISGNTRIRFKNKDKANRYVLSEYVYTDSKGAYSVSLPDGTYDAQAEKGDTRSRVAIVRVAGSKSGVDFSIPVYPITVQVDKADVSASRLGTWIDADGKEYGSGDKLYLKAGTYHLSSTVVVGLTTYLAGINMTVNANVTSVRAVVTQTSAIIGTLTENQIKGVVLRRDYQYLTFIPTQTKEYDFYSEGKIDTRGILCDAEGNRLTTDDDSGVGSNFKITWQCTSGTTYYIGFSSFSSWNEGEVVDLIAKEAQSAE